MIELTDERNIKISLDKAREWYNRGGEYKELALSAFTEKEIKEIVLPNSWEEFCEMYPIKEECYIATDSTISEIDGCQRISCEDKNMLPSKEVAKAYLALMQLHQLRDCYRQGWVPDWGNVNQCKWCIIFNANKFIVQLGSFYNRFLSFKSKEIAEKFLKNFKDLIETAGDLI